MRSCGPLLTCMAKTGPSSGEGSADGDVHCAGNVPAMFKQMVSKA